MASIRQLLDNTLWRVVLCTATNIICDTTTPQASASGKVSAGWTFWRELNLLLDVSRVRRACVCYSLLPESDL